MTELLTPHLDAILHMAGSGLVTMVDHDRTSDLSRMYNLFLLVPSELGKDALRFALRADVEDRGKAINDSANEPEPGPSAGVDQDMDGDVKGKGKVKPATSSSAALGSALRWVQDVLDLKDKFDKILDEAFVGDKAVQTSINLVRYSDKSQVTLLTVRHSNHSSTRIPEHLNFCLYTLTST